MLSEALFSASQKRFRFGYRPHAAKKSHHFMIGHQLLHVGQIMIMNYASDSGNRGYFGGLLT